MSLLRPSLRPVLAVCLATGLGLVPLVLAGQPASAREGTAVTVQAPEAGPNASVTVSRTTNLVNQTVEISWKGFRPSSQPRLNNAGQTVDETTTNPVRVYQCRGDSATSPASPSDCYGAPGFRGVPASGDTPAVPEVLPFTYPGQQDKYDALPDGPANWQDAATADDGTGVLAIQLFTKREAPSLGCDGVAACSLVVVPNYGPDGDASSGATEDVLDAPWAWERRVVVPLTFLPTEDACPLEGASVPVEGTPVAARLMASWRARTCTLDSGRVRIDYTAIGEPQTRADVTSGTSPLGLVLDPVPGDGRESQGLVHAPVAATGLVVGFQVDDKHGRPVRDMRLTPRLVAKLVTASYRQGGNSATDGNPVNLFRDPDFLKVNPGTDWPSGAPGNHVLLLGDLSDTTAALTRWIGADPEARAFIAGKPDPWGMKVNRHYQDLQLPISTFPLLDPLQSDNFEPVQGLDHLARQLSIAQFPGAITTQEGGVNIITKPPRQSFGSREVIGIVDAASASDYRLATADLRNAGGAFVGPTDAGILAGVAHARSTDGVLGAVDATSKDKAIYPLTLIVNAALSTRADKQVRGSMAAFLDYAAKSGQVPGDEAGELPGGYVPLPASLTKSALTARAAVLEGSVPATTDGSGDGSGDGASGGTGSGGSGGGSAPPGDFTPAPSSTVGTGAVAGAGAGVAAGDDSQVRAGKPVDTITKVAAQTTEVGPVPLGKRLFTLPALLLLGLLVTLAGPAVLLAQRYPGWRRWLRR